MRKIIILITLLNTAVLYSQDMDSTFAGRSVIFRNLRLNIQANALQTFSISDSLGKRDFFKDNSVAVGIEWIFKYKNNLNYGIGILYQFPGSVKALNGKVGNIPVYAYLDFPIKNSEIFPIQLSFRLGPSFLLTEGKIEKNKHGLYHAIGVTTEINKRLQVKLLYANDYGRIKIDKYNYDLNNGNMSFVLCLKF